MEKENQLVSYLMENMKYGRIVFNKNPRNKHRIDCWSFMFIDVPGYDTMLVEAMTYFKNLGYIVVDKGTYIEIDDLFAKGK